MKETIYTLTDECLGEDSAHLSTEERVDALLNDALGLVLRHLGVDLSGDINNQIEQMEIIVEHCHEESNSEIRGTYVMQRQGKEILPVAFIGIPRIQEQKIEADLVMFRGEELKA